MGNIVLLDELTINKIAAGEVIERPASVVKEMIENSIDAGAKNITVEIKNGGISFIKITDDGKGIAKDDVEMAFERHATSKIRTAEDLNTVKSMGFRGEALASISAIANVELVSKTEFEDIGTKIVVEGGNILLIDEIGCSTGTTITVRNLFYNTPVRYKFLKRDFTESGYIEDVVSRIALIHPEISIKLINSGKVEISTNGSGNIQDVIYSIFGKETATNIINVDYEYENIKIKGVVGKKEIARSNRTNQILFVNQRYIKNKTLTSAIDQAFNNILPFGKFAFLVLNVDIPTSKVDVNVHPAKLEVRFEDENTVFKAMYHAIKDALYKDENGDTNTFDKEQILEVQETNKITDSETTPVNNPENTEELNYNKILTSKQEELQSVVKKDLDNSQKSQISMSNLEMIEKLKAIQEGLKKEVESNPNLHLTDNYLQMEQKYNTNLELEENKDESKANEDSIIEDSNTSNEPEEQEITININNTVIKEHIGEEDFKNITVEKLNETIEDIDKHEVAEDNEKIYQNNIEETENYINSNEQTVENRDIDDNKNVEEEFSNQVTQNINLDEKTETDIEQFEDDKKLSFKEMYKQLFGKEPYVEQQNIQNQKEDYTANEFEDANLTIFENDEEYNKISYRYIGVAFNKYVILEINNELYFMNQNVAYEKIIYEKLKKDMYNENKNNSQLLLLPDIITLTQKQMDIAKDNFELFYTCGFDLEEFGENTIKLSGVPEICVNLNTEELFKDLLDEINQVPRNETEQKREKCLSIIATKIAEQENLGTSEEEVNDLINQLLKFKNPFISLNGKQSAIKLSRYEIERKFARK